METCPLWGSLGTSEEFVHSPRAVTWLLGVLAF